MSDWHLTDRRCDMDGELLQASEVYGARAGSGRRHFRCDNPRCPNHVGIPALTEVI